MLEVQQSVVMHAAEAVLAFLFVSFHFLIQIRNHLFGYYASSRKHILYVCFCEDPNPSIIHNLKWLVICGNHFNHSLIYLVLL